MTGITATDLFCGAGGSAIGLHNAGIKVVTAANHWDLAVQTHQTNFPDTDHDVADISQVDPRRYPATDILWVSPECTRHSIAAGVSHTLQHDKVPIDGLPSEAWERSRATAWDAVRFADNGISRGEPYAAIIVENVVPFFQWVLFRPWLNALESLGYESQLVFLNSMFAGGGRFRGILPAPQSRDRLYVVLTRKGASKPNVDIRPTGPCGQCGHDVDAIQTWKRPDKQWGCYNQQYIYTCPKCMTRVHPYTVPALTAIDWSLLTQRIGDRTRPLAYATMRRIQAGIDKHGGHPMSMLVPLSHGNDWASRKVRFVDEVMPTQTTRAEYLLAMPPFIASIRGGGSKTKCDSVMEPMATVSAGGNHHQLVVPPGFVMRNNNSSNGSAGGEMCTAFTEPMRTLTTKGHQSVVTVHGGDPVSILDCGTRMLQPHEQGAGMAFPTTYVVLGNKRERTKQYGNAVTPPASELLATAVVEALTGKVEVAA